jgi:hypothetical protein
MDSLFTPYHKEANMVLIGEGKPFKYEFDWSKARIPAFAAVSPNLETGPTPSDHEIRTKAMKALTLNECSSKALIIS